MLKMVDDTKGRTVLLMFCDVCSTSIEDANSAALVFKRLGIGATSSEVLMVHKKECHDAAEERLGGSPATGWHELSRDMYHLLHNTRLSASNWIEMDSFDKDFGTF